MKNERWRLVSPAELIGMAPFDTVLEKCQNGWILGDKGIMGN
jgi:hypothetical protein